MRASSTLRRTRFVAGILLAAVFLAGGVTGAALERFRASSLQLAPASSGLSADQVIENMKMAGTRIPVMYEALDLTPPQRADIAAILESYQPRVDSLLRDSWPALHVVIDSVRLRVEQVLTPEQRRRLATMRRSGLQ